MTSHYILITGCAGFIGSHLTERLLAGGKSVIGIDNFDPFYDKQIKERNLSGFINHPNFELFNSDVTRADFFEPFKDKNILAVFHLAAKAGVRPSILDPQSYIDTNISGTLNVLNYMVGREIKNLVFASSSSVYGNSCKAPFKEDEIATECISPYAFTKRSCELMNYTYHHLYHINIVNLRFFTVYGPRQRPDLAINKFIRLMVEDKKIPMYGDGSSLRDYTFIDDIVDGTISALSYILSNKSIYDTFNLGNSDPVSLRDLVKSIGITMRVEPNIKKYTKQPGDVDITCANIDKAQALLDYNPKTSLTTGLGAYYSWYSKQKNTEPGSKLPLQSKKHKE